MSPAMRYAVIRHKDAVARKAARHYNIKTAATLVAVLTLGSGVLAPAVAQWAEETIDHTDPNNPVAALLALVLTLGFAIFALATIVAKFVSIVIVLPVAGAAVGVYAYDRFAKATSRWPYDVPPLGVEALRTRHGDEVPIEYDPQTGISTAYQPNGEVLQRVQHDTDKQDPYSS